MTAATVIPMNTLNGEQPVKIDGVEVVPGDRFMVEISPGAKISSEHMANELRNVADAIERAGDAFYVAQMQAKEALDKVGEMITAHAEERRSEFRDVAGHYRKRSTEIFAAVEKAGKVSARASELAQQLIDNLDYSSADDVERNCDRD